MKIAASSIAWRTKEDASIMAVFKKHGIAGVEIAPTKQWSELSVVSIENAIEYKNRWLKRGIGIVATQALLFGQPELKIFYDTASRNTTLEYLKIAIDVTSNLGASVLVFGSPKNRWVPDELKDKSRSIGKDFFYTLAEYAQKKQVYFCIEPISAQYGCNFITDTKEAIDFITFVDHPYFALNLDAAVMTLNGEDYEKSITKSVRYLRHFHVSEPDLAPIGTGAVDHARLAALLRTIDYQHWVSIEMKEHIHESNEDYIDQALSLVNGIYR